MLEMIGDGGWVAALLALIGAVWKAYQAKDATIALDGFGKLLNPKNKEVTKISDLNGKAHTVLTENADAVMMTDDLKKQITDGLADSRKTEIINWIWQNEHDGIPGDSYVIKIPEKGVNYEIFAGKISNIIALENLTEKSGNTGDPGSCEIVRVWGGNTSRGSNIPQRQPTEITVEMDSRRLFANCKATEVGGVTLAVFADRRLIGAKIADFQANDLTQAKENNLSYSVYDFAIPAKIVQEARETDGEFDIVVAWARGGKWYYLLGENGADVPWEDQVSLKALCPAKD